MMLDAYIVAVSPPGCGGRPDFEQPLAAHQHSHIDVSCIHISAKFYYLRSSRDGVAAANIVNWDTPDNRPQFIPNRTEKSNAGNAIVAGRCVAARIWTARQVTSEIATNSQEKRLIRLPGSG